MAQANTFNRTRKVNRDTIEINLRNATPYAPFGFVDSSGADLKSATQIYSACLADGFQIHKIMRSIANCFCLSKSNRPPGVEERAVLASETPFSVNEVEALYVLFEQLSSSIVDDGQIHKDEFLLALFNCSGKKNLLAERLFELFDLKRNGVIEFGEFVRSLSIFHPDAPVADKIAFAFRLYDLRHTGYIEREELKEMVLATLNESELSLSDDVVEEIVDKTLQEADLKGDGKIDPEEWKELVGKYPSLIKNMTLPYLREITLAFPGFVMMTEVSDSELASSNHKQAI